MKICYIKETKQVNILKHDITCYVKHYSSPARIRSSDIKAVHSVEYSLLSVSCVTYLYEYSHRLVDPK